MALTPKDRLTYYTEVNIYREAMAQPCGPDTATEALSVLAAMLDCKLPSEAVLAAYIRALSEYPADLVKTAIDTVIKTQKYRIFPLLGDILPLIEESRKTRTFLQKQSARNLAWQKSLMAPETDPNDDLS